MDWKLLTIIVSLTALVLVAEGLPSGRLPPQNQTCTGDIVTNMRDIVSAMFFKGAITNNSDFNDFIKIFIKLNTALSVKPFVAPTDAEIADFSSRSLKAICAATSTSQASVESMWTPKIRGLKFTSGEVSIDILKLLGNLYLHLGDGTADSSAAVCQMFASFLPSSKKKPAFVKTGMGLNGGLLSAPKPGPSQVEQMVVQGNAFSDQPMPGVSQKKPDKTQIETDVAGVSQDKFQKTPGAPKKTPVAASLAPLKTQKPPVASSLTPMKPQTPPVASSSIPLKPQTPPIASSLTSDDPQKPPKSSSLTPEEPKKPPMASSLIPDEPQKPPMASSLTPDEPHKPPKSSSLTPEEPKKPPMPSSLTPDEPQKPPMPSSLTSDEPQKPPMASSLTPDEPQNPPMASSLNTYSTLIELLASQNKAFEVPNEDSDVPNDSVDDLDEDLSLP